MIRAPLPRLAQRCHSAWLSALVRWWGVAGSPCRRVAVSPTIARRAWRAPQPENAVLIWTIKMEAAAKWTLPAVRPPLWPPTPFALFLVLRPWACHSLHV